MKTLFIVNPNSAHQRAGKIWRQNVDLVRKHFSPGYDVVFTQRPLHATQLAREGIHSGYDRIISVGGDGTLNEVVNGFFENGQLINPECVLGVLEIGTGADFRKTIGAPKDFEQALIFLNNASPSPIDIGKATFLSTDGRTVDRYFINILDFGIGGAVAERVNRTTKVFGGKISFLWSILITLMQYKNKTIRYRLDKGEWQTGVFNNFIIANGRYFGGGLMPAPNAQLNDGVFDVVFFGEVGKWEAVTNLSRLRSGTHITNSKVTVTTAKTIEAEADVPVFIDMDGEMVGSLPIKIEMLPGVVRLLR